MNIYNRERQSIMKNFGTRFQRMELHFYSKVPFYPNSIGINRRTKLFIVCLCAFKNRRIFLLLTNAAGRNLIISLSLSLSSQIQFNLMALCLLLFLLKIEITITI